MQKPCVSLEMSCCTHLLPDKRLEAVLPYEVRIAVQCTLYGIWACALHTRLPGHCPLQLLTGLAHLPACLQRDLSRVLKAVAPPVRLTDKSEAVV
jgi:hypothetical protein